MTVIHTPNFWRFTQPEAPNLKYGVKPNGKIFVKLREELTQGVRPFDDLVTAQDSKQMGYFCDYVIDIIPPNGVVHVEEDGRGFWYVPQKGFTGEDVLSYRIVNSMNQTSEPGCITFIVDNVTPIGRIFEQPELIETVILQDANADYWVEKLEDWGIEKEREIYAYNTVPDALYTLLISGSYSAKYDRQHRSNSYVWTTTHHIGGTVKPILVDLFRTVDFADYDVFKFTTKFDYQTLGIIEGWPNTTPDGRHALYDHEFNVGFTIFPQGDIRRRAKVSNRLNFIDADFETYPRDISQETRDKLSDKSTYHAQLDHEIKQPLFLINGQESIGISRTTRFGRSLDITGKTYGEDDGVLTKVATQKVFYPFKADYDWVNLNRGYNINGEDREAEVVRLILTLSDIPAVGGNFALVAHIDSLNSVFKADGFEPFYLERDVDQTFTVSPEFKGLVVLETFTSPTGSTLLATAKFAIIRKFSANVEYLSTLESCLNENGGIDIYPVDFGAIKGLTFVPINHSGLSNPNMLSTKFIPFVGTSTFNYPEKLSATTRQIAHYGDSKLKIPPAQPIPSVLLDWAKSSIVPAEAYFVLQCPNNTPLRIKFRAVNITNATTSEEIFGLIETHRKGIGRRDWLDYHIQQDPKSIVAYDQSFRAEDKILDVDPSSFAEVMSIKVLDGTGLTSGEEKYAVVIDIQRMLQDFQKSYKLDLSVFDGILGKEKVNSVLYMDTQASEVSIMYGFANISATSFNFVENVEEVYDTGDVLISVERPFSQNYEARIHLIKVDENLKDEPYTDKLQPFVDNYYAEGKDLDWKNTKRAETEISVSRYQSYWFESDKDTTKLPEDFLEKAFLRRKATDKSGKPVTNTEVYAVVLEVDSFDGEPLQSFDVKVNVKDLMEIYDFGDTIFSIDPLAKNTKKIVGLVWIEKGYSWFKLAA